MPKQKELDINAENLPGLLPFGPGFRFVDQILEVSPKGILGCFTFREDLPFYADHFPGMPITPGVILTECMAQIGLAAWGIYLFSLDEGEPPQGVALTSSKMEFMRMVAPGERVEVRSSMVYRRLGKLKVEAVMTNSDGMTVCKGILAGMILKNRSPGS